MSINNTANNKLTDDKHEQTMSKYSNLISDMFVGINIGISVCVELCVDWPVFYLKDILKNARIKTKFVYHLLLK